MCARCSRVKLCVVRMRNAILRNDLRLRMLTDSFVSSSAFSRATYVNGHVSVMKNLGPDQQKFFSNSPNWNYKKRVEW